MITQTTTSVKIIIEEISNLPQHIFIILSYRIRGKVPRAHKKVNTIKTIKKHHM